MRKIMIVFVLGLFLIPSLSFARTLSAPASQASYWSKLKKKNTSNKTVKNRFNYRATKKSMRPKDAVEIRAGERPVTMEREDRMFSPRPEGKMPLKPELELEEEGIMIPNEVSPMPMPDLEESYSEGYTDNDSDYDSDKEHFKERLKEIRDKIKELRKEEKEIRDMLRDWGKEKKEHLKEKWDEKGDHWKVDKMEEWEAKKKEAAKEKEAWLRKKREEKKDWYDDKKEYRKDFRQEWKEEQSMRPKEILDKDFIDHGVREEENPSGYEMEFQNNREDLRYLPEDGVSPRPEPEPYYDKSILEGVPETKPVIPDFSTGTSNFFPPASSLQQSMFESPSWQKLRERKAKSVKKMNRYNKLRSLGGRR